MALSINLRNERTGEIKNVKVGWSWTLFFFSQFFGIPLFLRKLNVYAFTMLIATIAYGIVASLDFDTSITYWIGGFCCAMSIYLGIKGNELTIKNYLENGWKFVDPESKEALMFKLKLAMG